MKCIALFQLQHPLTYKYFKNTMVHTSQRISRLLYRHNMSRLNSGHPRTYSTCKLCSYVTPHVLQGTNFVSIPICQSGQRRHARLPARRIPASVKREHHTPCEQMRRQPNHSNNAKQRFILFLLDLSHLLPVLNIPSVYHSTVALGYVFFPKKNQLADKIGVPIRTLFWWRVRLSNNVSKIMYPQGRLRFRAIFMLRLARRVN